MKELKLPAIAGLVTMSMLFLLGIVWKPVATKEEGVLEVSFLDVGQGDATFIESPTGTRVLIDGGADSRVLTELTRVMDFFDTDIDMIVATHPDQDHIGGLIDVLIRYDVQTVLMTENVSDTPVYESFLAAVEEEGAEIMYARSGQSYDLGSGLEGSTTLSILFPDHDPTHLESNLSSIVARVTYGNTSYLLMGDAPIEIESYLGTQYGRLLGSMVLKVGHHGSRTSSSDTFVATVSPRYAIISAGKDNSYGHPHREVIETLNAHDIVQKNTADEGSIFSLSDGSSLWFR